MLKGFQVRLDNCLKNKHKQNKLYFLNVKNYICRFIGGSGLQFRTWEGQVSNVVKDVQELDKDEQDVVKDEHIVVKDEHDVIKD